MGGEWEFKFFKDDDDESKASEERATSSSSTRTPKSNATLPRPKFDTKKYQSFLLQLRNNHQHRLRTENSFMAIWSQGKEPANNIFAQFTYTCRHPTCVHDFKGERVNKQDNSTAGWTLYWDPTKVPKEAGPLLSTFSSDVYTRCAPPKFIYLSVEVQKSLALKFPNHFQLYLPDGESGCDFDDENPEGYWGYRERE